MWSTQTFAGWCFFNEAHVAILDRDWRPDFSKLWEIAKHCPKICCMTATLQPHCVSQLASQFGRSTFSQSLCISPYRSGIQLAMKVTQEPRLWIEQQLLSQPLTERAIIFCLFRKHVEMMVSYLKSKMTTRQIFECSSGATDDLSAFQAASGVMVCTSVLSTGVTFEKVTRVYFLDCCHGPRRWLSG